MYRIVMYSFVAVLFVACATDTTNNTEESTGPPEQLPIMEDPVIVTFDSIQAEEAQTPEIDSMAIIRDIEGSSNFTRKGGNPDELENHAFINQEEIATYTNLAKKSFKCMGNEPFWNIEIKGEELIFHQMGYKKEVYPLTPTQIKADRLIYSVKEKSGKNNIQVELLKMPCEDDMSGLPFAYSIILVKNGKRFQGCAKEILN